MSQIWSVGVTLAWWSLLGSGGGGIGEGLPLDGPGSGADCGMLYNPAMRLLIPVLVLLLSCYPKFDDDDDDDDGGQETGLTGVPGDDDDGSSDTDVVDDDNDNDGYSEEDGDCDDDEYTVNPGAEEICDGIDNDCDGETDEGCDTDDTGSWGDTGVGGGDSGEVSTCD